MNRVYNFSAGPSMLPEWVLKTASEEMMSYSSTGQSVMEMSHRSKEYMAIIESCESLLREVMGIPDNYRVLFLQGGASTQFAMVPLNLMNGSGKADYVVSGQFSKKAYKEASRFGDVKLVASSEADNFSHIPSLDKSAFTPDADYFHICENNTIYGTKYHVLPDTGNVPLVADISSCILSEPIDISKYGLLYAGAQKNVSCAGLTLVIVREDLVGNVRGDVPVMMDYKTHVESGSMYNTPPTYAIYICMLVLKWIKEQVGGLENMGIRNREKAKLLYDYLDASDFYTAPAHRDSRSIMNVTFKTRDADLDKKFCAAAEARGLVNIKGHRSVGGMRASIYNAMPRAGIEALVAFMKEFENDNK